MQNILELPMEIFFNIFPYLTDYDIIWNVGLVCKKLHLYSLSFIKSLFIDEDYNSSSPVRSKDDFMSLLELEYLTDYVSHIIYRNEAECLLVEEIKQNVELNHILLEIKESQKIGNNADSLRLPGLCKKCVFVKELISIRTNILPKDITEAVSYLKHLTVLILFCKENELSLSDDDVIYSISKCVSLEVIVLMDHCKITDNAIISISENCRKLKSLNIHGCDKLTDRSIVKLTENCPMIKSLDLYKCDKLTDISLVSIAVNLKSIEEIDLGKCIFITDEGVKRIATSCKNLVSFDGSSCLQLSDDSPINLAKNCKNVEFLAFEFCQNMTNNCVDYLQSCENLRHLDLNGCPKISNKWWLIPRSKHEVVK